MINNRELYNDFMTARGINDDISLAYLVTWDLNLLKRILGKEISISDAEKYAQVRERLLPLWCAERRKRHDRQPRTFTLYDGAGQ